MMTYGENKRYKHHFFSQVTYLQTERFHIRALTNLTCLMRLCMYSCDSV